MAISPIALYVSSIRTPSFFALACALACVGLLLIVTTVQSMRLRRWFQVPVVVLCLVACTLPAITLGLFLRVFVIGGSSSVAQLAGPDGYDLMLVWNSWWPVMLVGNPLSVLLAVVAVATPPHQPRFFASFALPVAALVSTLAASHLALQHCPSA